MGRTVKVNWLIDIRAFPEDANPLLDAIQKFGHDYKVIDTRWIDEHEVFFPDDQCVIFYGSLEKAKVLRKKPWIPGVYCDLKKYECKSYYPIFGDYILNSNYIMLPYGELLRQKEFLYDKLGQDRAIFLRPDVGDKTFTGEVVFKEKFDHDIPLYDIEPNALVISAEPVNIKAEWRFVVVNQEIISGSLYKENNIVGSSADIPQEASEFAKKLAKLYNPERVWVIDICQTKAGDYKVVEIGCFSCAGLYACDRLKIVEAVSDAAIQEWKEYAAD